MGTDMEWGPMGELMTEKGGPMPLMGELRVLMGECSCPGELSEEPMPGPREGCSEGAAMGPRPVGELREEAFTWVEKSVRQEATGGQSGIHTDRPATPRATVATPDQAAERQGTPPLQSYGSPATRGQARHAQSSPPRHQPHLAQL